MRPAEKFEVLCIGSVTMDFIARPEVSESIDVNAYDKVQHFLCLDFASKTALAQIEYEPGGSAANSANAMALLGSKTELLSAVGDDEFGRMIERDLAKRRIGTDFLSRFPKEKSAIGISILSPKGEKSILVYHGANDLLGPKDISLSAVRGCDTVFITSLGSESNFALFQKAVGLARRLRKKIVFAPSITMLRKFSKRLSLMHKHFDMCVMNYEEAVFYTKNTGVAEMLRELPGKTRVISMDSRGAYAFDNGEFYHCEAPKMKIVDTTGAGDAFTGALAHEYRRTGNIAKALSAGTAMAAIKLGHMGPRIDLPAADVRRLVARNAMKFRARKVPAARLP